MTDDTFNTLVEDLKMGGHLFIEHLYVNQREACLRRLLLKTSCERSEAEDWFTDALLVVRRKAYQGQLKNGDLGGYLYTCCYRYFLASRKRTGVELLRLEGGTPASVADLTERAWRGLNEFESAFVKKYDLYEKAWEQMDEKCRKLLSAFYLQGAKLKDLQDVFGMGSYDSMKTTKKRCLQKIRKFVQELDS